jgi:proteasome lid subunit RPN8/RPN11
MQYLNSLRISQGLLRTVIAHCRREAPKEACGLLAGKSGRAFCALPMPNVATDPERTYLVESEAQLSAFRYMAGRGWELIGIYHSHPTAAAIPSSGDIEQAHYPEALHLIVGLRTPAKPDVRLYRLVKQTRKMVSIRLIVQRSNQTKTQRNRQSIGQIRWGCSLR